MARRAGAALLVSCLAALVGLGAPAGAASFGGYTWTGPGCVPSAPVPAAEFLLEHMSRVLWDPVDPRRLGSLDPRLHARVNGEIYRFSRAQTLDRFRRDPIRWSGIVRDPVSGQRFIPGRRSPRLDTADSPYFFISDSTQAVFRAAPERWAIHRRD